MTDIHGFRLTAAGLMLAALVAAATPVQAQGPAGRGLASTGADLIVHRVAGVATEGGACVADLTYAAPAGKALVVEAVRAYGFSKVDLKGATPRFRLTRVGADGHANHELQVGFINAARRYFAAGSSESLTVTPGTILTAKVELPAGGAAQLTCRFQVEGRLVDSAISS